MDEGTHKERTFRALCAFVDKPGFDDIQRGNFPSKLFLNVTTGGPILDFLLGLGSAHFLDGKKVRSNTFSPSNSYRARDKAS